MINKSIIFLFIFVISYTVFAQGPPSPPGGDTPSYSGATTITSATTNNDGSFSSTTADQNALLISTSEEVVLNNPTVTKSGDSNSGDNCNFYGINSGVTCKDGGITTINGGVVTATAQGANGIFSYGGNGGQNGAAGDGTTVNINGVTITTSGSNGGGIMTTGGGITNAKDCTVTTSGQSSAPMRTDRGGGVVNVIGGTYTSSGLGSPAIYSTADITAENAIFISQLSEGVCIEGKNSITLVNSNLTATNTKCNGQAKFFDSVMIYQSMSGDADTGTATFTMTGGKLTSNSGHVFHVTNTNAVISINDVEIVNNDNGGILLSVCADGWSGGKNNATMNAIAQNLEGKLLVGDDSFLSLNLLEGSYFTGTISGSITNAAGTVVSTSLGTVDVKLDSTSKWKLTEDTYINSFTGDMSNVINNSHTLYIATSTTSSAGTKMFGMAIPIFLIIMMLFN